MKNLNEMTSKELKEMAKEMKISNWWNLKKSVLIEKIEKAQNMAKEETISVNNLVETPAPEKPVAYVENEEVIESHEEVKKEIKKPSLKIKDITYNGETKSIREWAEELEMPWPTLYDRINRNGWTVEEAIKTPLGGRRKK